MSGGVHARRRPVGFEEFKRRMALTCGGLTPHEEWLLSQGWAAGYEVGATAESEVQRLLETEEEDWPLSESDLEGLECTLGKLR